MTSLLNGQAVKIRFGSASVTARPLRWRSRAQVAPANPPPITTTRVSPCACEGRVMSAAEAASAPPNKFLRLGAALMATSTLLADPGRNGAGFLVGKAFGDAIPHRNRT